jgi:hypothetical protein
MEKYELELTVNDFTIELSDFPGQFVTKTIVGGISSLKGGESIRELDIDIVQNEAKIIVNGEELSLTPFPNDIVVNTISGMVSSLKGVDKVETVQVKIKAV